MLVRYVPPTPIKKKIILLSLCIVVFLKKTSVIRVKRSRLWTPAQGHPILALTVVSPPITVIKGVAGSPRDDPHRVDGLSGATITSRGVSHLVRFWLGEQGFGPFLEKFREARST